MCRRGQIGITLHRAGVAAQDRSALVGGWQMDVNHLDGGKLFQDRARRQARRQALGNANSGDLFSFADFPLLMAGICARVGRSQI
jgi:hypothetical protein